MNEYSSSFLYGRGIFSTISIIQRKPFLWEKHWRRLTENAEKLGIDLSEFDEACVVEKLTDTIEESPTLNGRARITFSDESPSKVWSGGNQKNTNISIITAHRRKRPDNFKLAVSPNRINTTSPLVGVKSCNYLEPILSLEEANTRGFHEALRLNEHGEVASACMANLFWLKGEKLFTPSLETGCLAGTTREFVLENLECDEVFTGIEAIQEADAIFLTSAGIGVVEVAEFDGKLMVESGHSIMFMLPQTA